MFNCENERLVLSHQFTVGYMTAKTQRNEATCAGIALRRPKGHEREWVGIEFVNR